MYLKKNYPVDCYILSKQFVNARLISLIPALSVRPKISPIAALQTDILNKMTQIKTFKIYNTTIYRTFLPVFF